MLLLSFRIEIRRYATLRPYAEQYGTTRSFAVIPGGANGQMTTRTVMQAGPTGTIVRQIDVNDAVYDAVYDGYDNVPAT